MNILTRQFFAASGIAMMILLGGCTVYEKSVPAASPVIQINIAYEQLEYLGEVTGSATQSYVLGIPYGGTEIRRGVMLLPGMGTYPEKRDRTFFQAMYKALEVFPDADLVLPVSVERKRNRLFLGREEMVTVRGKAFRLRVKVAP